MQQQRLINLTFHGIGEPPRALDAGEADVWVDRDRFEVVLDAIAGRDDVRITFDDGNASDVEVALPALVERGLTATFFVCAGRMGQPGFLSVADIRRLLRAGMTVGSHGMHHRPWRGLDDAELREELVGARRSLELVVGAPVDTAACPFGAYDRRVVRALRDGGYRRVYTSDRGVTTPDAWIQARTSVTQDDGDHVAAALAADGSAARRLRRRAKQTVKRWR